MYTTSNDDVMGRETRVTERVRWRGAEGDHTGLARKRTCGGEGVSRGKSWQKSTEKERRDSATAWR